MFQYTRSLYPNIASKSCCTESSCLLSFEMFSMNLISVVQEYQQGYLTLKKVVRSGSTAQHSWPPLEGSCRPSSVNSSRALVPFMRERMSEER